MDQPERSHTEPIEAAIQALRRALADAATECDRALFGHRSDAAQGLRRLPAVLERLAVCTSRVQAALERGGRHE
jgi:hypothetical protein